MSIDRRDTLNHLLPMRRAPRRRVLRWSLPWVPLPPGARLSLSNQGSAPLVLLTASAQPAFPAAAPTA